MSLYELTDLKKTYAGRDVLSLEHLVLEPGKIHAVLGPNGAGKTTLFQILAFLEPPTTGEVVFQGSKVEFGEKHLVALRRQVVLLHQNPVLFSGTVLSNVGFGLKARGVKKAKRRALAMEALARVGLESFAQARATGLSGGETQRVALARALVLKPRVLLCDEPAASVDAPSRERIMALLADLNQHDGVTVLFTSHDAPWAGRLAHHTLYLDQGRVLSAGGENILEGTAALENGQTVVLVPGTSLILPAPAHAPGPVRLALDPEKLAVAAPGDEPSSPNAILGKIIGLHQTPRGIHLLVDAGIVLEAVLNMDEYKNAPPALGSKVQLIPRPGYLQYL